MHTYIRVVSDSKMYLTTLSLAKLMSSLRMHSNIPHVVYFSIIDDACIDRVIVNWQAKLGNLVFWIALDVRCT